MKKQYFEIKRSLTLALALMVSATIYAQDVHFTFANPTITNDGMNDWYEVDVMIQTINTTGTFKLGKGLLYFNYNTAAFGSNLNAAGGFDVVHPNPDYIAGQFIDAAAADLYGVFSTNDNSSSIVTWAYSQVFSSSTFAADNVTETPARLCRIRFQYTDVGQPPMVSYNDDPAFDDQFETACGPAGGGAFTAADCGAEPGTVLVNDTFDSSGATLGIDDFRLATGVSVYPNPTSGMLYLKGELSQIDSVEVYNVSGQLVSEKRDNFEFLDLRTLAPSIYFVKFNTPNSFQTVRIVVK